MLGPALAALQFAPLETAKAVHITVAGTASMVGRAVSRTTKTISHATEESVQEIARRTQTEQASACTLAGHWRAPSTMVHWLTI